MDRGRTIEVNAILEAPATRPARAVDADALFDSLYAELHRIARRELHRQGPGAGSASRRSCTRPT
jgi:hypothetical protein